MTTNIGTFQMKDEPSVPMHAVFTKWSTLALLCSVPRLPHTIPSHWAQTMPTSSLGPIIVIMALI